MVFLVNTTELEVEQKSKLLESKIEEIQSSREAYKISKKNLIEKTKGLLAPIKQLPKNFELFQRTKKPWVLEMY